MLEITNKLLWAVAISLILINSIYFSIKLKFPQLKIIKALKNIKTSKNSNGISAKDTLIMALSSKIGVGSLAGTSICIYYGGLGTIFWIFISPLFLSIITYIENTLSIIYKDKQKEPKSGPSYYIKKGLNNKTLALFYSVVILIAYSLAFPAIQNNTITTLVSDMYSINKTIISLIITITAGVIILKGIKTVSNICNKIFPIMMTIFITIGLIIISKNINQIPSILIRILTEAFNKASLTGGTIYTMILALQKSVFANESGVGTSAIISGVAENTDYKLQAKIGLIQTYFINFIVLGITSFIIVTAQQSNIELTNGIELTKQAFSYHLGTFGEIVLLITLLLFSFSTIITIYYYGESSLKFITNSTIATKTLKLITIISVFTGGIITATKIWPLIDILLAILTIINMYAIYKLKTIIISKLSKK